MVPADTGESASSTTYKPGVAGSKPAPPTNKINHLRDWDDSRQSSVPFWCRLANKRWRSPGGYAATTVIARADAETSVITEWTRTADKTRPRNQGALAQVRRTQEARRGIGPPSRYGNPRPGPTHRKAAEVERSESRAPLGAWLNARQLITRKPPSTFRRLAAESSRCGDEYVELAV